MKNLFVILLFLFMTSATSISLASDAQNVDESVYCGDESTVNVAFHEMEMAINAEHMKPSVDVESVIGAKKSQSEMDFSWLSNYVEVTMLPGETLIDSNGKQHPLLCFGERSSDNYMVAALTEASVYDEANQRNELVIWHFSIGPILFD